MTEMLQKEVKMSDEIKGNYHSNGLLKTARGEKIERSAEQISFINYQKPAPILIVHGVAFD